MEYPDSTELHNSLCDLILILRDVASHVEAVTVAMASGNDCTEATQVRNGLVIDRERLPPCQHE